MSDNVLLVFMSFLQQVRQRYQDFDAPDLRSRVKPVSDLVRAYGKYLLTEFLPVVVAYGLIINYPASVLLGLPFTFESVLGWGLVFYLVDEELTSIINDLQPVVKVSARVDN